MADILAFNKWNVNDIKVDDPGLQDYISLDPRIVPKTGARYACKRFHKSKIFIVERLINKLMIPGHKGKKHQKSSGHCTGKAANAYSIVQEAFKEIEQKTNQNPIAVYVKALENGAPREEILTIEYGGARYPKAVECAPQRRIDVALRQMVQGAYTKSFNKKKSIKSALADEIMFAANVDNRSQVIAKKLEVERQADSSR